MAYILCARNRVGDSFGSEPSSTYFLSVPGSSNPKPKHKITKTQWIKEIQKAAESGTKNGVPTGDIVFFVHGYNNTPETVVKRHRKIEKGLKKHGFKGVIVSFDWPSGNSALNYLEDRHDAKQTMLRLVNEGIKTFARLQRPDCKINQHIIAHSMGCYVVREAFDDADDIPSIAHTSWTVSQIAFLAADVSSSALSDGSPKSNSLYRHCVRLTNYYNHYDGVLSLSNVKRVGVSPRAGRVGLPDDAPGKSVNIYCGNYYKEEVNPDLDSPVDAHSWYFDDDSVYRDLAYTIDGSIDRTSIPGRVPTTQGNLGLTK